MESLVTVASGITLLLGGLLTMRFALQKIFSRSFKQLLLRLTVTPWRGMLAGTVAAAMMQSSTSVTLLTVGLVSAEYLSFYQSLGIILGANIGTCSTVQLLTLSLPPTFLLIALALSVLSALLLRKWRFALLTLAGMLGMLVGVNLLSRGLATLTGVNAVITFLTAGANPLYGIAGGILLTFFVQSSSAATGLLMVLSAGRILDITTATYAVYGNNIGSCLSSLVISITAPMPARRVAVAHIVLNILGVIVFLPLSNLLASLAASLTSDPAGQIAAIHTLFNLLSSLAVLPIIRPFSRLILLLVPEKNQN